jgi:hypothetical protein
MSAQSSPADGRNVAYVSNVIWTVAADAAEKATEQAAVDPHMPVPAAISAIIIAAASTEAFINELGHFLTTVPVFVADHGAPEQQEWGPIGHVLKQLEKDHAQAVTKYMTASVLLPGEALDPGRDPLQSYKQLMRVRHEFVHPKPQTEEIKDGVRQETDLMQFFIAKQWTVETRAGGGPHVTGYFNRLQTPEVARWACRAAMEIVLNISQRFVRERVTPLDIIYGDWSDMRKDPRIQE